MNHLSRKRLERQTENSAFVSVVRTVLPFTPYLAVIPIAQPSIMDFAEYFQSKMSMGEQEDVRKLADMMLASRLRNILIERRGALEDAKKHKGNTPTTRRSRADLEREFPLQVNVLQSASCVHYVLTMIRNRGPDSRGRNKAAAPAS